MSRDDQRRENIFEIMDGMMRQMSRTKKIFVVMILSVLIVPPVSLLAVISFLEPPFEIQVRQRLDERLEMGQITQQEYNDIIEKIGDRPRHVLASPHLIIVGISLFWLGVGIRQWFVISKWDKRYRKFKEEQKDIDKRLGADDNSLPDA